MPQILPFRPYRYHPEHVPSLGAVIAPPYDVISPERRRELMERDPHNVIGLILPEGDAESRYDNAARLFRTWISREVLIHESCPALFPYAQIFTDPRSGDRIERRGLIAALRLAPFSAGEVLPHERTLSGPKADRLSLMLATDANLEAIFGVYGDRAGASTRRLAEVMESAAPIVDVTDSDGVQHRLWRTDDPAVIDAFRQDLAGERVFIVDGHHRYETALEYQRLMHEKYGEGADAPYDYIMIFLAPSTDPGLVILPTHRVLHSLPAFSFDGLLEQLSPNFVLAEQEGREAALAALEEHWERPCFLLATGQSAAPRIVLAVLREDAPLDTMLNPSLPDVLKHLDVTILHEHILQRLLGITPEAQADQRNLRYVKSADDAFASLDAPDVQCVVLMNPTRLEQVEAVAQTGEVMPQKSTFFYPKLASGLLFNPLNPQ